ncbi:MAG: S4 domain-containing protein, partial [Chitinophagaceae bacterium]
MIEGENVLIDDSNESLFERRQFIIDKGQEPMRIDKWLHGRIEGSTRNKIQQNIDAGFLTVNNKIVKSNYKVKPGDEILLLSEIHPEYTQVKAENIPLDIVYEDEAVLV